MVAIHRNQAGSRPHVLEQAIHGHQCQSMAIHANQWQSMPINAINGTHLRADVLEQVINVGLDERVAHH
jgi:hypothetical protein